MKKEKSGKLINDRTESFGVNFLDTILLSLVFSLSTLVFLRDQPLLGVVLTGFMYLILVVLRTTRRKNWVEEVIKYFVIKEFLGGEVYVERKFQSIKDEKR